MFRSVSLVAGALLLAAVPPAFAQPKSGLEADAIAFGTRESAQNMDLSPDGSKVVFLGAGPGRSTVVYVADIAAGSSKPILYSKADPEALRWCEFVSNMRLACRFTAIVPSDGTGLAPAGILIPVARMIAIDIDGKNIKQLGQPSSQYDVGLRQYDGEIIDWLPGGGDSVLMTRVFLPEGFRDTASNVQRTKRGVGVVKLNVKNLSTDIVEQPRDSAALWMSDGQGHVRLMSTAELSAETYQTGRYKYVYRTAASRDWSPLTEFVREEDFAPLAIDASINALYALRKRDGRMALSRITLDATPSESIIAQNPRVDIDNVVRSGDGQRVIGYTYAEDYRKVVYFDPEYKTLSASLSKALPKQPLVTFIKSSEDGNKVLLFAGTDQDAGRYYLFDKAAKSLGEVMQVRPSLAQRTLSPVKPITYEAADGTVVPAYLTLPAGKAATGLPAVVLPHGGPSARDEWGFDWLSQFLAARGYAVIQPNYRGSAGYGEAWLAQNGFKGWRTSIGDVSSAARYLVSQRIADPNRLAIVGWSYGGYAALQSAATEPSLYKAVVAIAPVTDLDLLKSDFHQTSQANSIAEFVGSGPHVAEGSPLRHAATISAPVLLVHGTMDVNVAVAHSKRMEEALQNAGKTSELLSFDGLDHQLDDSNARALMLSKIGALLDRTIGH
jgi:dipeptidyl aminopeptidase/acylaminoacyl peptidase